MTLDTDPAGRTAQRRSGFLSGAFDSDVHPNFRNGIRDLAPYVESTAMRKRMGLLEAPRGSAARVMRGDNVVQVPGAEMRLPGVNYTNPGGTMRLDAMPPDGGPPGSDPRFVVTDHLDRHDLGGALLIGGSVLGLGGIPEPEMAAAVASAHNLWLEDVWCREDPRFRIALVVAPQDPALAVAEVHRWGRNAAVAAVYIPGTDNGMAFGHRHYHPIYEAALEHGLPVVTHPGGESSGTNGAMIAVGKPEYYLEFHASIPQVYMRHLISLVVSGVFERFPTLRFGLIEAGWAWLPHVLWRLDKDWKGLRDECPWLQRLPSEYVLDHVRFTSQPIYEPPDPADLGTIMRLARADRCVMFSSDYPHWDADAPEMAYRRVPGEIRRSLTHDLPSEFFRLDPV